MISRIEIVAWGAGPQQRVSGRDGVPLARCSRRYSYQAANARMPDADRLWKVRKTMARIKTVLTERALTYQDPQLRMALKVS